MVILLVSVLSISNLTYSNFDTLTFLFYTVTIHLISFAEKIRLCNTFNEFRLELLTNALVKEINIGD